MAKKKKPSSSLVITSIIIIFFFIKVYIVPIAENEPQPKTEYVPEEPKVETIVSKDDEINEELKIHFIDVGQADSILISLNDSSMLIDAGNNADGDLVVDYIKDQGIKKLDYIIGTHPHEDHIGGLDNVIYNFKIDKVLMPKASTSTKTFEDVLDAISSKNLSVTTPKIGDTYSLNDAKFTILSCKNEDTKDLNSASIVIRLEYEEQNYIFCGDAESDMENEMIKSGLDLNSNVIKLGHHGSATSSSEKFIKAVNPEVAIITVGENNDYGHPHREVIELLDEFNIKTYRTDLNGTIVLVSDGTNNKITTEKGE